LYRQLAAIRQGRLLARQRLSASDDEIAGYIANVHATKSLPYRPIVGLVQIR